MQEDEKNKEVSADELVSIKTAGVDLSEFEGKKAEIEKLAVLEMDSSYDEEGLLLPKGQTRRVKVLKVITGTILESENSDKEKIEFKASELFNLKYDKEAEKWGYSESPKSKIQKFFTKMKVKTPKELIGKTITIRTYEKNDSTYMGFVL